MTYFLTTSKAEQDIVVREFGYSEETAPILGFSRWDALVDKSNADNRTILVMPTWRQWLEEIDDEIFVASEYFQAYSDLLSDERLEALLERNNATIKFFIHPKLSQHLKNFNIVSDRVQLIDMGSTPLNELIMECSMLITDYSSVAWDVLYMRKPVLYFQFDQSRYLDEVGSYIDFNTELPGPVCLDKQSLLEAMDARMAGGYTLTEDETAIRRRWFDFEDTNNRARTYSRIVDLGY
jgi:CDP-glycerol glycerophosphotransferase (TagB/SpsB family)